MAGDNPMGRDIRTALNKALRTGDFSFIDSYIFSIR